MITHVHFDETLPTTHLYPLHPETGHKWPERFAELQALAKQYAATEDEVVRTRLTAQYDHLSDGLEFMVEAHFVLHRGKDVMLGLRKNGKTRHEPEQHVTCHPRTWRELPDAQKRLFTVSKPFRK